MKTNLRFLQLILMLMLTMSTAGVWGQPNNTDPAQTVCLGTQPYLVVPGDIGNTFFWSISTGTSGTDWVISSPTTASTNIDWLTPGTYTVTFTETNGFTCITTVSVSVTVLALPIATISYSGTPYCASGSATVTQTGQINGSYSSTAGLSIDPGTGTINLAASIPGNYTVTYSFTLGTCSNTTTANVTILTLPTATISGAASVCQNGTAPDVTFTGANGTLPYTFTYKINGGSNQTITTTSGNSVTVPAPTSTAGPFTYALVSVQEGSVKACSQLQSGTTLITVNPLPVPIITGPATACITSTSNTYSAEAGMTNYIWTVSAGGTVTAGGTSTDNTVTVTWTATGAQSVSVNYSNANSCTATAATVYNVTVNPLPVPIITGPATSCVTSTSNTYSTEAGMTNYVWTVSAGGTITAGGTSTDNTVTVTWTTAGAQSVSVNYNNANSCYAATPTLYNVTVNPLPAPTITGPSPACAASTGNVYITEAGMTEYTWTISGGGIITSVTTTNSITVTWNTSGAQTVSVNYKNGNGCSAASATVKNVTVNPLPATSPINHN
jgi:hypothetical protein